MAMPEGFKTISPWPWRHIADKHIDRVVDANGTTICNDNDDGCPVGPNDQSFIALAPDHALLLAAVMRGVFALDSCLPNTMIVVVGKLPKKPKLYESPYTLDPFGCPVLSDDARTAIVKALEA